MNFTIADADETCYASAVQAPHGKHSKETLNQNTKHFSNPGGNCMILATWNCNRGPLLKKLSALARLNADLIVVPELPQLPPQYNGLWVGENRNIGLAIIPNQTTILVQVTDIPELPSNVVLAHVTGPISFLLLAVWAKKESEYVEGLHRALDLCEKRMAVESTVVLGDFNSNTIWDNERNRRDRGVSHTDLVDRLDHLGLVSAYHTHFVERHGQERQPTLYFRKEQNRPFHIDYCFVPKIWKVTEVTVGSYDEWKAVSDHMPLVVDVEEPSTVNRRIAGRLAASSALAT